jgi:23S rRNA pseudouridine955/2504/2580 synthase
MEERSYTAGADDAGRRLDRVARRLLPGLPLDSVFRAIRKGAVRLNGALASASHRVAEGDVISTSAPAAAGAAAATQRHGARPAPVDATAALAPLLLLHGEHVLALNKPAGMPAHGPDSAAELVAAFLATRRQASLSYRPGPAHRLDRGTSGLLLFSCSLAGAQTLAVAFRERALAKSYLAVVEGEVQGGETWEDRVAYDHDERRSSASDHGDVAITLVSPLATGGGLSLLLCSPITGRTHQIRAQAALRGRPLAGDARYGGRPTTAAPGYLLHALSVACEQSRAVLGFDRLVAPPPPAFVEAVGALLGPAAADAVRAAS